MYLRITFVSVFMLTALSIPIMASAFHFELIDTSGAVDAYTIFEPGENEDFGLGTRSADSAGSMGGYGSGHGSSSTDFQIAGNTCSLSASGSVGLDVEGSEVARISGVPPHFFWTALYNPARSSTTRTIENASLRSLLAEAPCPVSQWSKISATSRLWSS